MCCQVRSLQRRRARGRTNDRLRNGKTRVTSQRQARHLRLIHLRNRMITAVDTARRTPGLAKFRILGQTVRRRLRESGLRAKRLVVGRCHTRLAVTESVIRPTYLSKTNHWP
jgi:hypothetical protein